MPPLYPCLYLLQGQSASVQTIHRPAPLKGTRVKRLTPALKSLPIDQDTGVRLDMDTAKCLKVYARYHGWKVVQQRDGDHLIIWRIG